LSLWIILTAAVGAAGGLIGKAVKIPAGALLGAMLTAAALNVFGECATFPESFRAPIQILSGTLIGSRITLKEIRGLKSMALPVVVLILGMIFLNLIVGVSIYFISEMDMTTALFSSAPGGLSDMVLISEELGANTAQVAVLHLVRLLTVLFVIIPLFKHLANRGRTCAFNRDLAEKRDKCASQSAEATEPLKINGKHFLLTLLCATAGGTLFYAAGISAGALIGAMLFATAFNAFTNRACFPMKLTPWLMVIAGTYLGASVTRDSLISLLQLPVPVMLLIVGVLLSTFAIAWVMHKVSKLPMSVCLLASTPGGLQEMSLLAEDMGIDMPKVAIMQTLRLFTVILIFPQILSLFLLLFS